MSANLPRTARNPAADRPDGDRVHFPGLRAKADARLATTSNLDHRVPSKARCPAADAVHRAFGGCPSPSTRSGRLCGYRDPSTPGASSVARVVVDVMPKPEILDPQGQAVANALPRLGFAGIGSVRQGKRFELDVDDSVDDATLAKIAETFLANPVVEDWVVRRVES